jgi:hypothetical protein
MAKRYARFKELLAEGIFSNRMDAARKVAGGFPQPIELGPNTIAWDRDEVEQWLASRPRRGKRKQAPAEAASVTGAV